MPTLTLKLFSRTRHDCITKTRRPFVMHQNIFSSTVLPCNQYFHSCFQEDRQKTLWLRDRKTFVDQTVYVLDRHFSRPSLKFSFSICCIWYCSACLLTSWSRLRSGSPAALGLAGLLKPTGQHVRHPLHQGHIWTLLPCNIQPSQRKSYSTNTPTITGYSCVTSTRTRWQNKLSYWSINGSMWLCLQASLDQEVIIRTSV